ncbi:uncharacterized protein [Populus alba]|uniref:uncharacterized protein isoform X1 n=1 Tax=Populus alba TaxID=43335 RepID=UPI003CC72EC9
MVKEFKSGFGFDCLMRIFAPDYNHLKIQVTDYHSNTFEDPKSVMQLDDLRDCIGIGGSWTELDKLAGRDPASTKVTNRVVSEFHRAKVRGALLQDTEDDENN